MARGAGLNRQLSLPRLIAAAVVLAGYLPLAFLGPGTDLDVGGVYEAGRTILDGSYVVSRTPGAPVFEAAAGLLHALGGTVAVNLVSIAMAVGCAVGVERLLTHEGHAHAEWFGLAVLLNPFVWIAGTSMVDFTWAVALLLAGAHAQLERRWPLAVVLYALAAGCRLSTLALVAAFLLGDLLLSRREDRRPIVIAGLATVAATAVVFLPPILTLGWGVLDNDVPASDLLVQVGRWGVKNWFFFGPVVVVLVLALVPRLRRAVPAGWRSSPILRMALLGAVAGELLFLRFPWKLAHLIPVYVCVVLVLGASRVLDRRSVAVLLVAQLVLGLVNVNLADPDRPDMATGGRFAPSIVRGPLWTDISCRLDSDRDAYRDPGRTPDDSVGPALRETWACTIPWSDRSEPEM